jgi:hypothetical protein
MYLTAHRVRTRGGVEGVNAYLSLHGDTALPLAHDAAPDLDRISQSVGGVVVARHEDVPPGGNQVLVFLELAAADGLSAAELHGALDELGASARANGLPVSMRRANLAARCQAVVALSDLPTLGVGAFDELRDKALALRPEREREQVDAGAYVVHAGYSFEGVRLWLPPATLARVEDSPMRRMRLSVPGDLLRAPHEPLAVLREAAQTLLGVTASELDRVGGIEILDPRTGTVFARVGA